MKTFLAIVLNLIGALCYFAGGMLLAAGAKSWAEADEMQGRPKWRHPYRNGLPN